MNATLNVLPQLEESSPYTPNVQARTSSLESVQHDAEVVDMWLQPLYRFAYVLSRDKSLATELVKSAFVNCMREKVNHRSHKDTKITLFQFIYEITKEKQSKDHSLDIAPDSFNRLQSSQSQSARNSHILNCLMATDYQSRARIFLNALGKHSDSEINFILN